MELPTLGDDDKIFNAKYPDGFWISLDHIRKLEYLAGPELQQICSKEQLSISIYPVCASADPEEIFGGPDEIPVLAMCDLCMYRLFFCSSIRWSWLVVCRWFSIRLWWTPTVILIFARSSDMPLSSSPSNSSGFSDISCPCQNPYSINFGIHCRAVIKRGKTPPPLYLKPIPGAPLQIVPGAQQLPATPQLQSDPLLPPGPF